MARLVIVLAELDHDVVQQADVVVLLAVADVALGAQLVQISSPC